ncbi:MAG: formylglycine-generating enzyme family protein [Planctomycetota bacterium]
MRSGSRPRTHCSWRGEDAESGLWEFLHLQSGVRPSRDAQGRLDPAFGIVLVLLPGGTATIGAQRHDATQPYYDPLASDRYALQTVPLRPFFLAKYELTRAQWQRAMGDQPWFFKTSNMTGIHPAENLSWVMADAAMRRLDLVLPTDAQWEYACRAGTTTRWSCGEDPAELGAYGNLAGQETKGVDMGPARFSPEHHDAHVLPAPVGSLRSNAFGLHDMLGNVGEVCADSVIDHSQPLRPGDGFRAGGDSKRARSIRGGAFTEPTAMARSAAWTDVVPRVGWFSSACGRRDCSLTSVGRWWQGWAATYRRLLAAGCADEAPVRGLPATRRALRARRPGCCRARERDARAGRGAARHPQRPVREGSEVRRCGWVFAACRGARGGSRPRAIGVYLCRYAGADTPIGGSAHAGEGDASPRRTGIPGLSRRRERPAPPGRH